MLTRRGAGVVETDGGGEADGGKDGVTEQEEARKMALLAPGGAGVVEEDEGDPRRRRPGLEELQFGLWPSGHGELQRRRTGVAAHLGETLGFKGEDERGL